LNEFLDNLFVHHDVGLVETNKQENSIT